MTKIHWLRLYLKHHVPYDRFGEMGIAILNQLIQILLHMLEHEVENVVLSNNFFQFDYVGVR